MFFNISINQITDKGKTFRISNICALEKDTVASALDEMIDLIQPTLPVVTTPSASSNANSSGYISPNGSTTSLPLLPGTEGKEKEKKKKGKRIVSVESGFESVQGRRKTMEDKHIIMDNFRVLLGTTRSF